MTEITIARAKSVPALQRRHRAEAVRNNPIAAGIAFPRIDKRVLHVFTDEAAEKNGIGRGLAKKLSLDPRNIVGLIAKDNIKPDVLRERYDNIYPYVFSPLKGASRNYKSVGITAIVDQFRRDNPNLKFNINKAFIYGQSSPAMNLAQKAHIRRKVMPPEGRKVFYRHLDGGEGQYKTVQFVRVDPETNLYNISGHNFVYDRVMKDDDEFTAKEYGAGKSRFKFSHVRPIDHADNDDAYTAVEKAKERTMIRPVLKNESRGAEVLLATQRDADDRHDS